MDKLQPLFNHILVKPTERTGILHSDRPSLDANGLVLAVGPDVSIVKVGDRIAFLIWGLNSVEIDGETFYLVPEEASFVLGRINVSGDLAS